MVRFGKRLRADQVEEWRGYYINYKLMKKKVKQYTQLMKVGAEDRQQVMSEFSKILDDQIEKVVLFILEQQGLLALCLSRLGEQRQSLAQEADVSHMAILREAYREIGLDLLKLVKFVELNATGIRKILKKFDKRFGYKFTDHYVTTRANHPYSQIQQVFKHVGVGAVVGALSRNLAEIQEHQGSFSIYDHPHLVLTDPVIESIKVSIDKLTHTTNPIKFLGQHAMIIQEELPIAVENSADDESYHLASLLLNLGNTFLYMVNTYIIVPTADDYAMSLGAAATVCGVIIGSMAVAQIFSSVYFSAWSNRSYFRPLVFSSIVLLVGNIMYATAFDLNSIAVLLIGRLLCGLGSARAVNRRYISDCVPLRKRMQASAGFVSASALGMACGPALAGLLQTKGKILGFSITASTLPGWVMAFAWFVNLLCLWVFFQEPAHDIAENDVEQGDFRENVLPGTETPENGLVEPLIYSDTKAVDNDDGENIDQSEEGSEDSRKPATSITSAYRLLTPSIKVQLLIYFMLKFSIEILISASSVVTSFYFEWSTSNVALFLALLGLTVLPVNVIVGSYISNIFEERKILLASEIMVLVGVALSFHFTTSYTVLQYVLSAFVTFVAAEVLEGVNLSLLSQVMSSRLARGTFNGGLLSTEAGTIARVMADVTITLAGNLGMGHLLNTTLLPSFLFCVLSVIATFLTYNSLY